MRVQLDCRGTELRPAHPPMVMPTAILGAADPALTGGASVPGSVAAARSLDQHEAQVVEPGLYVLLELATCR